MQRDPSSLPALSMTTYQHCIGCRVGFMDLLGLPMMMTIQHASAVTYQSAKSPWKVSLNMRGHLLVENPPPVKDSSSARGFGQVRPNWAIAARPGFPKPVDSAHFDESNCNLYQSQKKTCKHPQWKPQHYPRHLHKLLGRSVRTSGCG